MTFFKALYLRYAEHPGVRRFVRMLEPLRETRCPACAAPVPFVDGRHMEPDHALCLDRNAAPSALPLCASCAAELIRRRQGFCPRCGELFSPNLPNALCGECLGAPRPWNRFFFHGEYRGLLRDLLLRFKNGRELALGALLGDFLATHPDITGPYDVLVPMPLHPERLRERGFNQSLEVARPLAKRLGIPLDHRLLSRVRHTRPQAGQHIDTRRENVRDVFRADARAQSKRILIVDDVATTCATLESATRTLLAVGASSVDAAVIGRTPEYRHLRT